MLKENNEIKITKSKETGGIFDILLEQKLNIEALKSVYKQKNKLEKKLEYLKSEFWEKVETHLGNDQNMRADLDRSNENEVIIHAIDDKESKSTEGLEGMIEAILKGL